MFNDMHTSVVTTVSSLFEPVATQNQVGYFVEGQTRDPRSIDSLIECRVDGPDELRYSGVTFVEFVVNIFVQVNLSNNYLRIRKLTNEIAKRMTNSIEIKEGNVVRACATLQADNKGRVVRTFQLGQLNPTIRVSRAAVMGRYRFDLN